jgi:hypothetical protein
LAVTIHCLSQGCTFRCFACSKWSAITGRNLGPGYVIRRPDSLSRSCEQFAGDVPTFACLLGVWVGCHGPGDHVGEQGASQGHWGGNWVHLRAQREGGRLVETLHIAARHISTNMVMNTIFKSCFEAVAVQ